MKCIHGIPLVRACAQCDKGQLSADERYAAYRATAFRSLHDEAVTLIDQFETTQPLPVLDEVRAAAGALIDSWDDIPGSQPINQAIQRLREALK